jgi:hypothetical protein
VIVANLNSTSYLLIIKDSKPQNHNVVLRATNIDYTPHGFKLRSASAMLLMPVGFNYVYDHIVTALDDFGYIRSNLITTN